MSPFSRRLTALCLAGISILWGATSDGVNAAEPDVLHQQSEGATAFFSNVDGCITTAVFVIADLESDGAAAPARASVAVQIDQADLCAVVPIISGTGLTTEAVIDVDPNLGSARVVAVVPTLNLANGSVFDALVDLTFTATSAIAAENGQEVSPDPPGHVTTFHRTFRDATATGSILGPTGELVPDASIEGEIHSTRFTNVDIR